MSSRSRRNISLVLLLFSMALGGMRGTPSVALSHQAMSSAPNLFLPLLIKARPSNAPPLARTVNAPMFNGTIRYPETAIFWFGQVNRSVNYTDVRVGYNESELYLNIATFDRLLWYDTTPSTADLTKYDSATIYLEHGTPGNTIGSTSYRFDAQLSWFESRNAYQAVYRGNGTSWTAATTPFTTKSDWMGLYNDTDDDKGWALTFRIPFSSLGLATAPPQQTSWRLAVAVHDRDDSAGSPIADTIWPPTATLTSPSTWGQLVFGLPTYTPAPTGARQTVTIRHRLNGTIVIDGSVGGGTICGGSLDYWTQWGEKNYQGDGDYNVQNQANISDWPCFSKIFITFPLDALPPNKVIVSASLTLAQMGASDPSVAKPTWVQVLTIADDWQESTLTWNNAPLAMENISGSWVEAIAFPGSWDQLPARQWDISRAVAQAYSARTPLRLVLYSADDGVQADMHTGKYFVSSDTGDWNAKNRPTLTVVIGDPTSSTQ